MLVKRCRKDGVCAISGKHKHHIVVNCPQALAYMLKYANTTLYEGDGGHGKERYVQQVKRIDAILTNPSYPNGHHYTEALPVNLNVMNTCVRAPRHDRAPPPEHWLLDLPRADITGSQLQRIVFIKGTECKAIVDASATISVIPEEILEQIELRSGNCEQAE